MDILNWLNLRRQRLIKTKANDAKTDLMILGAEVPFTVRGDKYQNYAMPLADAVQSGCIGNTKHYELDITTSNTVTVNTTRGIIDITGMGTSAPLTPLEGYGSSVYFAINNPDMDLTITNRDNIYIQYSVYYKQGIDDNAIPYLISTGINLGPEFNLYNANPATADTANWTGALYVYYEIYTIN